jgi:hypothetical protein
MPILKPPAWAEDHDKATMARAAPTIKTLLAFIEQLLLKGRSSHSLRSAEELDRVAAWNAGERQVFANSHYRRALPVGITASDFVT